MTIDAASTPVDDEARMTFAELFGDRGELGADLAAVDWASTPLGPLDSWPQSLVASVRILLSSRFAMWMSWGPELTFLCNDAYRRDTLATKYPWALGRSARAVWAEIWSDIGPRIDTVMRTGQATWDEGLLLFVERSGYVEESYHTFSYSPLTDDAGTIVGMLCVVVEETERVVGQRRLNTLLDLRTQPAIVGDELAVVAAMERQLERNPWCLPFTLSYLFDEPAGRATLVGRTGIPDDHPLAPADFPLEDPRSPWPAVALHAGTAVLVEDLAERFGALPTGSWEEPPTQVLALPLLAQGGATPYGFLAVGLNRFRPFDAGYRAFLELIAGRFAEGIAAARAYDAERRRAQALAELDADKTAFFTNVSHELRTPLTLLLGPAEDALADETEPLPAGQRHRLQVIDRNAQRLHKLVNTLLDFSRLQAGPAPARFEAVDLAQETSALVSMFETALARAALSLSVETGPTREPVYVDRDAWAKIVMNLMSNALKFTFDGGITVRLRQTADTIRLEVADTGIGIGAEDLPRLFERFQRVSGARSRSHEGTGIGLALVDELARLHGGSIRAESSLGCGSTFVVELPRGCAHLPSDQVVHHAGATVDVAARAQGFVAEALAWLEDRPAPLAERRAGEGPPPSAGEAAARATILVVDDNADMRSYISGLLTDYYTVWTAADGAAALELAREQAPDLVLTDVMMPRLDGFGLLKALNEDPDTTDVPVVMLSARSGETGTIDGLQAGASDYLVKPFTARELLARVRSNLELDRVRRTRDELQRNRLLLDQAQRLARVASWDIDLQTRRVGASDELVRQLGVEAGELDRLTVDEIAARVVHPDDIDRVRSSLGAAMTDDALDYEVRFVHADGSVRRYRTIGEVERDADGRPVRLRGSNQDITEQRLAEQAVVNAAAVSEAAARETQIADELQRSLLPAREFTLEHLDVAAAYQPGVAGTQVGGDWYDVIELSAGRTALVIGDVMGRGVPAAAVMGQLRAAVRAYARLDLEPAVILELMDAAVRELGEDQIVTCLYAIYDPMDSSLTYANAGHLPPLLRTPGQPTVRLSGSGPPLGSGPLRLRNGHARLAAGATVALYTDGLVERRTRDIDAGIDALAAGLDRAFGPLDRVPEHLIQLLLDDGLDDDVALLLARAGRRSLFAPILRDIEPRPASVGALRSQLAQALESWEVPEATIAVVLLLSSELVTNALLHGRAPIAYRLRHDAEQLVLEVHDAASVLPRERQPTPDDEHGRGLQLVTRLAQAWGTRPLPYGKAVWCTIARATVVSP